MQMLGGARKSDTDQNFKSPADTHFKPEGPREANPPPEEAGVAIHSLRMISRFKI